MRTEQGARKYRKELKEKCVYVDQEEYVTLMNEERFDEAYSYLESCEENKDL